MDTKTHILLFDDVVSNDLCDSIRTVIDKTDGITIDYGERQNLKCKLVFTKDIKNTQLSKLLDDELYNIVSNIVHKIRENAPNVIIGGDTGYLLRKIHGATRLHVDHVIPEKDKPHSPRSMSVIIALNDDYEGGELCFPNQDFKIKLKKGQAIAFPPYWTHPHYTNKPLNGTFRYTVNTWLTE